MKINSFLMLAGFFLLSITTTAYAYPVFSSSLGGGTSYSTQRGAGGSVAQKAAIVKKKVAHKTVLRYAPTQYELTEEQMKSLMPLMRRLQNSQVEDVEVVGIAKDGVSARERMSRVVRIIASYAPNIPTRTRSITDDAVIPGNDDTVEIIEYR